MNKLIIGLAALVLLAAGGALAGGAVSGSSSVGGVSTSTGPTTDGTTTTGTTAGTTAGTTTAEDVSGPCDEAEHANDPRCGGAAPGAGATAGDDDNHVRDGDREDRSGPNRGSDDGGDDDHSGSSGHSGSDDD